VFDHSCKSFEPQREPFGKEGQARAEGSERISAKRRDAEFAEKSAEFGRFGTSESDIFSAKSFALSSSPRFDPVSKAIIDASALRDTRR
jgi:hypothetical protein